MRIDLPEMLLRNQEEEEKKEAKQNLKAPRRTPNHLMIWGSLPQQTQIE